MNGGDFEGNMYLPSDVFNILIPDLLIFVLVSDGLKWGVSFDPG